MSDIAVRVEGLSKQYRIGRQPTGRTLYDAITAAFAAPFRRLSGHSQSATHNPKPEYIWALKDVTFDLRRGEVLGIIGRNGAGKSTLLKVLSRITEPTEGAVDLYGKVSSLLEVGTGFHPELTGRENVFLNGAILGMRRWEIARKFDEIVAFAEVEPFLDMPVKHYSSGMYLRLAFAVAAYLEPEILLVDEVLAVGDAQFQRKCLGRMGTAAGQGETVLFVSHNLHAVSTLTKRTIVVDAGRVIFDGDTPSALALYRSTWNPTGARGGEYEDLSKTTGLTRAHVITSHDQSIHRCGEPLTFEFEFAFAEKPRAAVFSFQIVDEHSRPIAHLWLQDSDQPWSQRGRVRVRCLLRKPRMYMGRYRLVTYLSDRASHEQYEVLDGICPFEIVMDGVPRDYAWVPGTCTYLEEAEWAAT
jgi:lipopolysaccharide transport system ATP-binding protein